MKVDRRLCEAISTLRPSPAFEALMDAIREDVNEQIKVVSTADGTPLYRAQGKIAALAGILELVGQARDLLDKPNFK